METPPHTHTYIHTDATENVTSPTYAGGDEHPTRESIVPCLIFPASQLKVGGPETVTYHSDLIN